MTKIAYQKFVARFEEVMELPPQRLGPLTPAYKRLVKHLKIMPWPLLILGASFLVLSTYILVGSAITFLVSLLQRGF